MIQLFREKRSGFQIYFVPLQRTSPQCLSEDCDATFVGNNNNDMSSY